VVVSRLSDQLGRVLGGRYRLLAPVGTGASALVFLAEDARLRRRVAVKLLHQALSEDEAFLRRFRSEAQAAAALNHPHILAVYDWGEDEHEPYLVTEYLGGGSLRAMLDNGQNLTPSQALMVGLEAARALDFAHQRGFVHRDIKPANLLFGEEGRLRVADFGLARALAEAAWTEPAGAMVGTARYACPEQARGEKVDGRGDVYSLALVLIEAVTGSVPFAGDTTIATLMARIDKPVEVPETLGPLRGILARAGSPNPGDRPDAGELAVGLLAAAEELPRPEPLPLAGATVSVGEISVVGRDRTQLPPNNVATAAIAGTASAAPVPDLPPLTLADLPKRRGRRWLTVSLSIMLALALIVGGLLTYRAVRVVSHDLPTLVGLTRDQAAAQVEANHWQLITKEDRRDGTVAGQVIEQDPPAGTSLAEDKPVTLTISLGNTLTDVPIDAVAGKPLAEATTILQQASLTVGAVLEQFDETVEKGVVISVDPNTPPQLPKNEAVGLIVSKGPQPRTIPAVTAGMTYEAAAQALAALQLTAAKVELFNDTVPVGQVIAFDPAAGTQVERGANVNVQVSKGPNVIPDVSRLSVADAADALQKAGYVVAGVDGNPTRTVVGTNPPAGTPAKQGTGVTIITR
jgi:serine/threonine-protein kinase